MTEKEITIELYKNKRKIRNIRFIVLGIGFLGIVLLLIGLPENLVLLVSFLFILSVLIIVGIPTQKKVMNLKKGAKQIWIKKKLLCLFY